MKFQEFNNIYNIPNSIFLQSSDILFIGHRLNGLKDIKNDYFQEFYKDTKYDIFVGKFKKNIFLDIRNILKIYHTAYEQSYIIFYNRKITIPLREYYDKFMQPTQNKIIDKILKRKCSELIEYNIIALLLVGDNEEWVSYCEIEIIANNRVK